MSSCRGYFYIPVDEGIGGLSYIIDSEGHALFLIKKSGLPEDIKKQLIGGNAGSGTYSDYQNLNDVYGVTADLKVYYSSGIGSDLMALTNVELDDDNPLRTVFDNTDLSQNSMYGLISNYDTDKDGKISVQEIKSVKSLTISSSMSLSNLYNLCSLESITFDGVTLDNLSGLENCSALYYIYFKNSVVNNYDALGKVKKLQHLYFYNIDDDELEKICSVENGIGKYDLTKLNYLGIVENNQYVEIQPSLLTNITTANTYSRSTKTISNLAPLANLTNVTKSAVQYLQLQCNSIAGSLEKIKDYTNLICLRCEYNFITSLNGLEKMKSLLYLDIAKNELGKTPVFDSDGTTILSFTHEKTSASSLTTSELNEGEAMKALANNETLCSIYGIDNQYLANVSWLANGTSIDELYLKGCSSTMNINSLYNITYDTDGSTIISRGGVLYQCSANSSGYSLPVAWLTGSVFDISDGYSYNGTNYNAATLSDDALESLENNQFMVQCQ